MDDYQYFMGRARNYRKVWNPSVGYFWPRHRDGTWLQKLSPFDYAWQHFTEGNAWQYAWGVPHDVKGLIALMGKDEFNQRLDEGFENERPTFGRPYDIKFVDLGNEQDLQLPWLFNYAGAPWLTQKWTREVLEGSYGNTPNPPCQ